MARTVTLEVGPVDLNHVKVCEVKIALHADGYRIWVNTEDGLQFRCYRAKELVLDLDGKTLDAKGLFTKE